MPQDVSEKLVSWRVARISSRTSFLHWTLDKVFAETIGASRQMSCTFKVKGSADGQRRVGEYGELCAVTTTQAPMYRRTRCEIWEVGVLRCNTTQYNFGAECSLVISGVFEDPWWLPELREIRGCSRQNDRGSNGGGTRLREMAETKAAGGLFLAAYSRTARTEASKEERQERKAVFWVHPFA